MKNVDIVIIGAGISGAVLAERYASIGRKVVIIEKETISQEIVMIMLMKTAFWFQNMVPIFSIPTKMMFGNM